MILLGAAIVLLWLFASQRTSRQHLAGGGGTDRVTTLFFNPSCGHCEKMMPAWDAAAGRAGGRMVKIDCSRERCPGVNGYPTIRDSYGEVYKGDRSMGSLLAFATKD